MSINVPETVNRLIQEMDKVVIGYADVKRLSIAALLADQHVLLEGLPGTAKSLFVDVYQRAIENSQAARLQMTPDVKPMDIVGVKIYNPGTNEFQIEQGPIAGKNFVLVDEINRSPGKTLSALLSAMQERRIYISGQEFILPDPFFVMATQNPVEQEGVYPLPEAQLDRFAMKIVVPYAERDEEIQILQNEALDSREPQSVIQPVVSVEEIVAMREHLKKNIFVSPFAMQYMVDLVRATRPGIAEHEAVVAQESSLKGQIKTGCSARASMAIRGLARVLAAIDGRTYVLPKDIQAVAFPVLRHRTALTFEAEAEGVNTDSLLSTIVKHVPFDSENDKYAPAVG